MIRLIKELDNIPMQSEKLTNREQDYILSIFNKNSVRVLDTYDAVNTEDGIKFREFVVSSDNTNSMHLGQLLTDLEKLEDTYDIGYTNESNDNGFYAYDYHFYHYVD